jgi:hypothetical protein
LEVAPRKQSKESEGAKEEMPRKGALLSWVLLWAGYTAPFRVLEVPAEAGAFAC